MFKNSKNVFSIALSLFLLFTSTQIVHGKISDDEVKRKADIVIQKAEEIYPIWEEFFSYDEEDVHEFVQRLYAPVEPTVVSHEEFEDLLSGRDQLVIYRGVHGKGGALDAQALKSSEPYVNRGTWGCQKACFSTDYEKARGYAIEGYCKWRAVIRACCPLEYCISVGDLEKIQKCVIGILNDRATVKEDDELEFLNNLLGVHGGTTDTLYTYAWLLGYKTILPIDNILTIDNVTRCSFIFDECDEIVNDAYKSTDEILKEINYCESLRELFPQFFSSIYE